MRVAFIHYWLTRMRGGERVLEAFSRLFPEADIFTHVVEREKLSQRLASHEISTTYISKLPFARSQYQKYLSFMPRALEELDLSDYDLVISSESGPAKGIIPRPDAFHLCYCHSPMRYIWDLYPDYVGGAGWLARQVFPHMAHRLRNWDVTSSARVDQFVANSSFVAKRIEKYYRRESEIVFPPVDVSRFEPEAPVAQEDYFLAAGEFVGYKRFDVVVDAFTKLGLPLVVVGDGEEIKRLKARAGSNVTFAGRVPFTELRRLFQTCRALVFPGLEDFGMIPVEVMAAGRPVIAYGRGGALDTVIPGLSGIHVPEQTVEAFCEAINAFRDSDFSSQDIIRHAHTFGTDTFNQGILSILNRNGFSLPQAEARLAERAS